MKGMNCAAESRLLTLLILFQEILSSMAIITMVATMRSRMVRSCCNDSIRSCVML